MPWVDFVWGYYLEFSLQLPLVVPDVALGHVRLYSRDTPPLRSPRLIQNPRNAKHVHQLLRQKRFLHATESFGGCFGRKGGRQRRREERVGLGTSKGGRGVLVSCMLRGGGGRWQSRVPAVHTQVPSSLEPIKLRRKSVEVAWFFLCDSGRSTNTYGYHPACDTHRAHGTAANLSRVFLPSIMYMFALSVPDHTHKDHTTIQFMQHTPVPDTAALSCISLHETVSLLSPTVLAHHTCLLHNCCAHVRAHFFQAHNDLLARTLLYYGSSRYLVYTCMHAQVPTAGQTGGTRATNQGHLLSQT